MLEIAQLMIFGLVLGGIVALGAVGVSLLFGILRFAHLAHGDMMTLGAYIALIFTGTLGLPIAAALAAAVMLTAGVAVALDRLVYRRLRRNAPVVLLFASFGVALMLRAAIQIAWGPDTLVYDPTISFPWRVGGLRIKPDHLVILAGTAALVVLLSLFLQRTRAGKAMRAMADNPDLARVTGIDTERVIVWTWLLGGGLAAAGGVFLAIDTRLVPLLGWNILLPVFAAAILGGIGKPYGAIVGGLVIGVATEMSTLVIEPVYKPAVAFSIIVAMLIWRPTGLLRGAQ
jgi:branched-chain amino acid transport system permease protein/neutral amino acid transport system permease protein